MLVQVARPIRHKSEGAFRRVAASEEGELLLWPIERLLVGQQEGRDRRVEWVCSAPHPRGGVHSHVLLLPLALHPTVGHGTPLSYLLSRLPSCTPHSIPWSARWHPTSLLLHPFQPWTPFRNSSQENPTDRRLGRGELGPGSDEPPSPIGPWPECLCPLPDIPSIVLQPLDVPTESPKESGWFSVVLLLSGDLSEQLRRQFSVRRGHGLTLSYQHSPRTAPTISSRHHDHWHTRSSPWPLSRFHWKTHLAKCAHETHPLLPHVSWIPQLWYRWGRHETRPHNVMAILYFRVTQTIQQIRELVESTFL